MSILDFLTPIQDFATPGRGALTPTKAVDVVAILGAGFTPLWSGARPLEAAVFEAAELMEHPIENGSVIADHLVVLPVEIGIPLACIGAETYRSLFPAMRAYFRSGQKLTVQTRTGTYSDMVIVDLPHEETPDAFNAIRIMIRLREAMVVTPQSSGITEEQAQDPAQTSTVSRGTQQTTTPSAASSGAAASSYSSSGAGAAPGGSTLYQWFGGP